MFSLEVLGLDNLTLLTGVVSLSQLLLRGASLLSLASLEGLQNLNIKTMHDGVKSNASSFDSSVDK